MTVLVVCIAGCSNGGTEHTMHQSDNGEPVNYLVYDHSFSSAGMPDAAFIQRLATEGVGTVINVAPPDASGALENEAELVAANGMSYINIAVDWNAPTQADVEEFLRIMKTRANEQVFLHCQMNMRATAFAMLHRVINEHVAPDTALADMNTIWAPNRTWATLINETLANHNVAFEVPVPAE